MVKKKNLFLGAILLALLVIVGLLWTYNNQKSPLITSEHFELLDDKDDILLYKDLSEINIMTDAVEHYNNKIVEMETELADINDDELRKAYYEDLAFYHSSLGHYEVAYEYYVKSLDLSFVNRKTWLSFGELLVNMQAYKTAEVAFTKANEINPYEELNNIKIVDLYKKTDRSQEDIIAVYNQGIDLIEAPTVLLKNKAEYYEDLELYREAINAYKEWARVSEHKEYIENKIKKLEDKL